MNECIKLLMLISSTCFIALPDIDKITHRAHYELQAIKQVIQWRLAQRELPLPASLQNPHVHHENVYSIRGLSCGLHTLISAALIEQREGLNQVHGYIEPFIGTVKPVLEELELKSNMGLPLSVIDSLAKKLNLQPMRILYIDDSKNIQIFNCSEPTEQYFKHSKEQFASSQNPSIMHFGCNVWSDEEHILLISLVKDKNNKISLFIRDNMNKKITESSDTKVYLDYLVHTFLK